MTAEEAAQLFAVIAKSIEQNPNQFNFRIMNVGMMAVGRSGAGPGVVGIAHGGAPGSRAVGIHAQAGEGNVNIDVDAEADAALAEVAEGLRSLAEATGQEDKGAIRAALKRLQDASATPAMIVGLANSILTLAHLL